MSIFWQFSVDDANQKRMVTATKEITIYSFKMVKGKNDEMQETCANNSNKRPILFSAGSLGGSYINKCKHLAIMLEFLLLEVHQYDIINSCL